jgi:hypothetical protein
VSKSAVQLIGEGQVTMNFFTFSIIFYVVVLISCVAAGQDTTRIALDNHVRVMLNIVILMAAGLWHTTSLGNHHRDQGPTVRRKRRRVSSIMYELGSHVNRFYRMSPKSFWKLHRLLLPYMEGGQNKKRKRGKTPNGPIATTLRLSIALRYFAGGCPIDISLVHGVAHSEVFVSVWMVVDAVNRCPQLQIQFPTSYADQRKLAEDFKSRSDAGFWNCIGAIDGILIWIMKPTPTDCDRAACGAKKFFCGRKCKFGLNMQATCDAKYRFLDVAIGHPGSTSDYLSFTTSQLYFKLEQAGFLAPGLALYGDNAYVDASYMVTPFKSVSTGPKDAYNFFQSQLRITIECAFGILVHRWGILRKPIPFGITIQKTTALVMCMCKLHNFCIDENDVQVPLPTAQDAAQIMAEGGVPMEGDDNRPDQLLDGGNHFDDISSYHLRQARNASARHAERSPREILLQIIKDQDFQRPRPKGWCR